MIRGRIMPARSVTAAITSGTPWAFASLANRGNVARNRFAGAAVRREEVGSLRRCETAVC
jgi:hypothetical protein